MLTQHIALVPEANGIDASELARVSAALQKQVTRDFSSVWGIVATVDAFPQLEDVPVGYWPILVCSGDLGNQVGVHRDRSGQPYALVQASKGWSLSASRACLEMLINPFESRTVTAPSLRSDQAAVEFLVEVCGPCESARHAYTVDGVAVSDFRTPAYFETQHARGERFSWSGSLPEPLKLISGGHITWYDPLTEVWWLRNHWGENPVDTKIGALDSKLLSVRELVQVCAQTHSASARLSGDEFARRELQARQASIVRAQRLRSLLGTRLEVESEAKGTFDEVEESEEVTLFLQEESPFAFEPVIEQPREPLRIEPEHIEFEPVVERSRKPLRIEPEPTEFEPAIERSRETPRIEPEHMEFEPAIERSRKPLRIEPEPTEFEPAIERSRKPLRIEPERIESIPRASSQAAPKRTSSLPPPLPPPTPRAPQVRASSLAPIGNVKRRALPGAHSRTQLIGSAVVGVGLGALLWAFSGSVRSWVLPQVSSPSVSNAAAEAQLANEPSRLASSATASPTQVAPVDSNAVVSAELSASKATGEKLIAAVPRPHARRAKVLSSASLSEPAPSLAPESAKEPSPVDSVGAPQPTAVAAAPSTANAVGAQSQNPAPTPSPRSDNERTANIDDLIDTRR